MEEQAVALYAGINGYLDDIPTEDVSRFQDELREHLRAEGSIYKTIRESGDIAEDVEEKLKAELDKFKQRFSPTEQEAS
jgi:F-type H+-transporting ATPase subunit alpha